MPDTEGTPVVLTELIRAMEKIREMAYEAKHVKCSQATWNTVVDAISTVSGPGAATRLYGLPIYIDDDLPAGRWEVGAGRRPQPDTEYQEAAYR